MSAVRLGLRANMPQFALLVLVNAFVGAMIGLERAILPAIAEQEFHLAATAAVLSFIVVFGLTKAFTNYLAGTLADRIGRKLVLIVGWVMAAPVPFLLMWAPTWRWVLVANALLGISQGLTWSTTVIMKIDLVGADRRGLAMGLNEFSGYVAVAGSALATGYLAAEYGLRPEPFYPGVAFVVMGLGLSIFAVRETKQHVVAEAAQSAALSAEALPSRREVFGERPSLIEISPASLKQDSSTISTMAWCGACSLCISRLPASGLRQIGTLVALYPATWGIAQLFTGAWSDRVGRKWLIAAGMWVQALGIATTILSGSPFGFATGAVLLGVGTAMVYPTLLAAIGDVAHPTWRASAIGVYRLWRDLGYAIGALLAGSAADLFGLAVAMWIVTALTLFSGVIVAIRMAETLPKLRRPLSAELSAPG